MRIRVVDYMGNPGGGVRFSAEMLRALAGRPERPRFEVVSHGAALERYRAIFAAAGIEAAAWIDLRPDRAWRTRRPSRIFGIPGTGRLETLLGVGSRWHHAVPAAALEGCDLAWFPWAGRHRLPVAPDVRIVASLHDVLFCQLEDVFRGAIPPHLIEDERETVRRWLASPAEIVVSARATVAALRDLFGAAPDRCRIVRLSGGHVPAAQPLAPDPGRPWLERPFLLCPANLSPHKDHETLIEGVAAWGARHPIVLTGEGTDEVRPEDPDPRHPRRGAALARLAAARGLELGRSLIATGYVPDDIYYGILRRAWALVMPTLGEGGGSFPVLEAMLCGVPVVSSDIPVMREMVEEVGGEVEWFAPRDPSDLARALAVLEAEYPERRARAAARAERLRPRAWADVALDYWRIFEGALARGAA